VTGAFRLATFNLENLDDGPDLEARIARLRPALLRLDADVLCLQEVHGQPTTKHKMRTLAALDRLIAGTPYEGFSRAHTAGGHGPFDVHNLVTLSRVPIIAVSQVKHDFVPAPAHRSLKDGAEVRIEWDRPFLRTAHDLGEGWVLHVLNLHLRAARASALPGARGAGGTWPGTAAWAEGFYLAAVKRAGQALEARLAVDALLDAEPRALIAVCGDLNAGLAEAPVRTLLARPEETGNAALAGRALAALEADVPQARRYSVRHGGRRVLLDHILASRALLARFDGAEIHNEGLPDEDGTDATAALGSFHAPVVARFLAENA
jgi:endonuclease/exonuclease/phosphatase family metal-dependent hydrolase